MKGCFIFPPEWTNSHPYLSIPCLMPYVKNAGIDIEPLDLNVHYRNYVHSESYLKDCFDKIKKETSGSVLVKYQMIYDFLLTNKKSMDHILHDVDDFADIEKYTLLSLYDGEMTFFQELAEKKEYSPMSCKTVDEMANAIEDREKNRYMRFYESFFETYDLKKYDVVLVSLAGTTQLLPALTLGRFIKKNNPSIKVIMGGNPFTKIINRINDKWKVFFEKSFDYISIFEGEYALCDLLKCLENKIDISFVPNCIYMKENEIKINQTDSRVIDIENGFIPDFRGYDLEDYDVPECVLPYYVTRGCYWKKCTFCDHDFGFYDCFRMKSVDRIIRDLIVYEREYHAKYIHFVDEAIPPKTIKLMCEKMLENGLTLKWFTCIKASKLYTEELCKLMKRAGCVYVSIGVESCSQDVLLGMNKGIDIQDIEVTLTNMKKAGIWAHCFMINNFEGETDKNRWETFFFIEKHKDLFRSIGIGNFVLSRNAKVYKNMNEKPQCNEVSDFSNDLLYKSETALTKEKADILCSFYNQINSTSEFFCKYIFEREHLPIWITKKPEILNGKILTKKYMDCIQYNDNLILKKMVKDKLYIYSLMTRKFYVLPMAFEKILNIFDGDVDKLKDTRELEEFSNSDSIIDFLINELYV